MVQPETQRIDLLHTVISSLLARAEMKLYTLLHVGNMVHQLVLVDGRNDVTVHNMIEHILQLHISRDEKNSQQRVVAMKKMLKGEHIEVSSFLQSGMMIEICFKSDYLKAGKDIEGTSKQVFSGDFMDFPYTDEDSDEYSDNAYTSDKSEEGCSILGEDY